MLNFVSIILAL